MKSIIKYLAIALVVITSLSSNAQVTMTDSMGNVSACYLPSTNKLTFTVISGSTGSYIDVKLPNGFTYEGIESSTNTNGGTITYAGVVSSPYHRFAISNTTNTSVVTLRFKQFAICGAGISSFTASDSAYFYDGSTRTGFKTASFNGTAPSLSITSPSNTPTSATLADTVTRSFTVTNGGFGPTTDFIIGDKFSSTGVGIITSSFKINPSTTNLSIPIGQITTNSDTVIIRVDKSLIKNGVIGNNDSVFNNSESFVLTYKMVVLTCAVPSITSQLISAWQCPGNARCTYTTVSTGFSTFGPALPNIVLAERKIRLTDCHNNSIFRDTLVLRNSSTGAGTDVVIDAGASYYSSNFRADMWGGYMDTASFKVKIGKNGTWYKPTYTVQQTITGGVYGCAFAGRPSYIRFTVPYLAGGDSLYIIIGQGQCDFQVTCNSNSTFQANTNFGGTAVNFIYKNACGNASFNGGWITGVGFRYMSVEGTKTGPGGIGDGEQKDFSFDITNLPSSASSQLIYGSRAIEEVSITLPNVIKLDSVAFANPVYFESPTGVKYYPASRTGNTFRFKLGNQYHDLGSQLHIKVKGVCDGVTCSGIVYYNVTYWYNPDTTGCTNKNRMFCQDYPIAWSTSCTTCCPKGMVNLKYQVNRTNYGLPDNNNDGVADGTFNLSEIRTKRTIPGDTIEFIHKYYLKTDATDTQFEYVRSLMTVSARTDYSIISDSVFIDRTTGTDTAYRHTPTTSGTDKFVTDISARGPFFQGDTVTVKLKLRVIRNPVATLVAYNSQNEGGASRVSSYSPQYSCGVFVDDQTIYGVDAFGYSVGTLVTNGCEQVNPYLYQYLRIAGGADRYSNFKFPNEVRHFAYGTKITQVIPKGYTLDSIEFYGYTGGATSTNQPYAGTYAIGTNMPFTMKGDTIVLNTGYLFQKEGGNILAPDEGYIMYYRTYITPTCATTTGLSQDGSLQDSFAWTTPFSSSSYLINSKPPRATPTFQNFQPNITISSSTPISAAYTKSVSWPVSATNLSGFAATHNWLYINELSGSVVIDSVKLSGAILSPDANGYYRYGTLNSGATSNFTVYGSSTACNLDSIKVYPGYSCSGKYPTSFSATTCSYPFIPLYVQPQAAAIQTQITALTSVPVNPFSAGSAAYGSSTVSMCNSFPMEMEIQSTQPGTIFNVREYALLPFNAGAAGVDLITDSITIEYPIGTTPRLANIAGRNLMNSTVSTGSMLLDLELLDSANFSTTKGLLGTGLGSSTTRRVIVRWKMRTNCDIVSGDQWSARQNANAPCGGVAQGNNTITSGFPIDVAGVSKPYAVAAAVTPAVSGCDLSGGSVSVIKLTKVGSTAPSSTDSVFIKVPQGTTFGTLNCYGPNCPGGTSGPISLSSLAINIAGGVKTYYFPVPATFDNTGDTIRLETVCYDTGNNCSSAQLMSAGVKKPISLTCGGSPCTNSSVNLGGGSSTFNVNKPNIVINTGQINLIRDTLTGMNDTMFLSYVVRNNGTSSTAFSLKTYQDNNTNGIIDGGDVLLKTNSLTVNSSDVSILDTLVAVNGTYTCNTLSELTATCACISSPVNAVSCNFIAVPVELTYFNVVKVNKSTADLLWQTASEINNDRFEIERKVEASTDFELIGTVLGSGNSNRLVDYLYTDHISGLSGQICYRLKQVDYDGTIAYSEVQCITASKSGQIVVYPNPTNSKVRILSNYDSPENEFNVRMTDNLGKTYYEGILKNGFLNIDLSALESGVYFITVGTEIFRVVKI